MTYSRLFAWGTNSHGQLGLGFKSELVSKPTEVLQLPGRLKETLGDDNLQINGGGNHTFILNGIGELFGVGLNASGQLDNALPEEVILFHSVEQRNNDKLKEICCGWDFSLGLEQSRRLRGWGSNAFGQLGMNAEAKGIISNAVDLCSAGLRFSMHEEDSIVSISGKSRQITGPQEIENVIKLSCGQNYCLALDANGQVFAWGDNKYGQCGDNPERARIVEKPALVKIYEKVIDIAAGWTHATALSDRGNVFSWGRNIYGQLGCPDRSTSSACHLAERIETLKDIAQIATGSEHCLALDRRSNLFTWGWNEHGNCGNGTETNVLVPEIISRDLPGRVVNIGSGAGHSFAVVIDN